MTWPKIPQLTPIVTSTTKRLNSKTSEVFLIVTTSISAFLEGLKTFLT